MIDSVESQKELGILIDYHFKFHSHTTDVANYFYFGVQYQLERNKPYGERESQYYSCHLSEMILYYINYYFSIQIFLQILTPTQGDTSYVFFSIDFTCSGSKC